MDLQTQNIMNIQESLGNMVVQVNLGLVKCSASQITLRSVINLISDLSNTNL